MDPAKDDDGDVLGFVCAGFVLLPLVSGDHGDKAGMDKRGDYKPCFFLQL